MSGKKIGYAKAITKSDDFDIQRESLRDAGCVTVFRDIVSSNKRRLGFEELLSTVSQGDTIVVASLYLLGSSLLQLLESIMMIHKQGATIISLAEGIDSKKLYSFEEWMSILNTTNQKMLYSRTEPARLGAVARGRQGGRPEKVDSGQIKKIKKLYFEKNMTIKSICKKFSISRPTVYKYLKL